MRSSTENRRDAEKVYVEKRIKRFLPCTMFAVLLMFGLQIPFSTIRDIFKHALEAILQISFASQLMPFSYLGLGGVLWFLSAGIVGGVVALLICGAAKSKYPLISLLISSSLYNVIINQNGSLDIWWIPLFGGAVLGSIVRAVAGTLFGVFVRYLSEEEKKIIFKNWIYHLGRLLLIVLPVVVILCVVYSPHTRYDAFLIIIFGILLIVANNPRHSFKSIITDFIDSLCLSLYIFQVSCIWIINLIIPERNVIGAILSLLLDITVSFLWVKVLSTIDIRKLFMSDTF